MLSPSGDVTVCPGSRPSFRCSTNLTFLDWIITVPLSGSLQSRRQIVTANTQLALDLVIEGHVFNITRNSTLGSYPLESVLTIANATAILSATKINCTEKSSDKSSSLIAIVDIINSRLTNRPCPIMLQNLPISQVYKSHVFHLLVSRLTPISLNEKSYISQNS